MNQDNKFFKNKYYFLYSIIYLFPYNLMNNPYIYSRSKIIVVFNKNMYIKIRKTNQLNKKNYY